MDARRADWEDRVAVPCECGEDLVYEAERDEHRYGSDDPCPHEGEG